MIVILQSVWASGKGFIFTLIILFCNQFSIFILIYLQTCFILFLFICCFSKVLVFFAHTTKKKPQKNRGLINKAFSFYPRLIFVNISLTVNKYHQTSLLFELNFYLYSRLLLSRSRRDPLKYFEISVLRHIRFAELRKIPIEQPNFTNEHVI